MGAQTFVVYAEGATAREAFISAIDSASYESGHGGYTGTIAEKHDFVVIEPSRVYWPDEASGLAERLLAADDPRISDKWGPAGALAVVSPTRVVPVKFTTSATASRETNHQLAVDATKGLLRRGETVVPIEGVQIRWHRPDSARGSRVTVGADVAVRRSGTGKLSTRQVSVTVAMDDRDPGFYAAVEAAVRTKVESKNVHVLAVRRHSTEITRTTKTSVTRSSGRATRYVVVGDWEHETFDTGFESLTPAVARLRALVAAPNQIRGTYEVVGVTRAADGRPFAVASTTTTKCQVPCSVEVVTGRTSPDVAPTGYLFFGWASS